MRTTAQIIDQHRQASRSVGYGVTVHCTCGTEHWAHVSGDQPIDDENNSHRKADRMHAQHVADVLAAQETTDAEVRAAAEPWQAHARLAHPVEAGELSCAECGYAFAWPGLDSSEGDRRYAEHVARAALSAARSVGRADA